MPDITTEPDDTTVDLVKPTDDQADDQADGAGEEVELVFDRNLVVGGYEAGERATLTRSSFIDGLIASGVAHEATPADDNLVVGEAGPEIIAMPDLG